MKVNYLSVCVMAALFAITRFLIPSQGFSLLGVYKDFTHMLIGGLFTGWLLLRKLPLPSARQDAKFYLEVFWMLTGVEVFVALLVPLAKLLLEG